MTREWLTPERAAEKANFTHWAVYFWIREIPEIAEKRCGRWFIDAELWDALCHGGRKAITGLLKDEKTPDAVVAPGV